MEEILGEVLLKRIGNRLHDKVLIVENMPRKFIFEQTRKMIQRVDRDGYPDGTMMVDPSGELIWTLRPGIEKSQTGDGGFVFDSMDRESMDRLGDIMRFIEMSYSRDQRVPGFVDNAQQIGDARTGPIAYSQMPRVSLPAPVAPVAIAPPSVTATLGTSTVTVTPLPAVASAPPENRTQQEPAGVLEKKQGMTAAHRAAASARMKKMHEDRKRKLAAA